MPIQVTCPGCHTRFSVGDQHAGKSGACPKCKGPIQIPEAGEEVVIHAPELEAGAKDSKGRSVLKPIKRKEAKFSANTLAIVLGLILLSVAVAWLIGRQEDMEDSAKMLAMAVGAILLGPLVSYAGYSFLSDDELGVYQGTDVLIRSLSCGLVFALRWGVYMFIGYQLFDFEAGLSLVQIGGLGAFLLGVGTFTAFVSFDLDPGSGFFHYALYVLVTVGLRFVMDLPFLPGMTL
jgi:hypothetical protein